MLHKTGLPSTKDIMSRFPSEKILQKPKAILGCYEEIPCDPCSTKCPFGAIVISPGINQIPSLLYDQCTGCGICVTSCPGLAIMVAMVKGDDAIFKLPYEMPELVKKGMVVDALDRSGKVLTEGIIESVTKGTHDKKIKLVTLKVNKRYLYDIQSFKVRP